MSKDHRPHEHDRRFLFKAAQYIVLATQFLRARDAKEKPGHKQILAVDQLKQSRLFWTIEGKHTRHSRYFTKLYEKVTFSRFCGYAFDENNPNPLKPTQNDNIPLHVMNADGNL